jgi:hypothetical protein
MELLQLSAAVLIIVLVFGLFINLNKKEDERI